MEESGVAAPQLSIVLIFLFGLGAVKVNQGKPGPLLSSLPCGCWHNLALLFNKPFMFHPVHISRHSSPLLVMSLCHLLYPPCRAPSSPAIAAPVMSLCFLLSLPCHAPSRPVILPYPHLLPQSLLRRTVPLSTRASKWPLPFTFPLCNVLLLFLAAYVPVQALLCPRSSSPCVLL